MKVNLLLMLMMFIIMASSMSKVFGHAKNVKKRQIYREQVLPETGKIPDSAFEVDRLALNRLQKEGIAIPDGYILEQRQHQVYQYPERSKRPVYHVSLTQDHRYTNEKGRYNPKNTPSIETTYLIPQSWMQPIRLQPKEPYKPRIVSMLQIPSPQIRNYQLEKPIFSPHYFTAFHPFEQVIVQPTLNDVWSPFHEQLLTTQIFNDFDSFFNTFHLNSFTNFKSFNRKNDKI